MLTCTPRLGARVLTYGGGISTVTAPFSTWSNFSLKGRVVVDPKQVGPGPAFTQLHEGPHSNLNPWAPWAPSTPLRHSHSQDPGGTRLSECTRVRGRKSRHPWSRSRRPSRPDFGALCGVRPARSWAVALAVTSD